MTSQAQAVLCQACNGETRQDLVYMTMWLGGELNIIEGVPAHVCTRCGEHHYDSDVQAQIRALTAAGFPHRLSSKTFHVPVFSLEEVASELNRAPLRASA
jgi:YgiT-type zinc finger domain-containing protein